MKYIFSVFCVLFGLTSSWADVSDFMNIEYIIGEDPSIESYKNLCGKGSFPKYEYLSCDHMEFEGYKCPTDGDGVVVKIENNENLKCGVVTDCKESVDGQYFNEYYEESILDGNGPNFGLFACFYDDGKFGWDKLEEPDDPGECCKDGDKCYRIFVEDYDYIYYDPDGILYKTKCPSDGQEVVDATVGDGASATVGDGASAATGTPEVVVGANVVENASRWEDIVNKLKQYDLLKRSAWVNKDGKFNTTRLLVDTGAGAVLGTVGGVIANKVIRKNQISSGMDGYQCVVNGQTVAEYGDDFVIDIYR